MVKFSKLFSESFHRDTDRRVVFQFRDTGPKLCVAYLTKNQNFPVVATARIVSKICQASPRQCTQSAPDFIQIG